MVQIERIAPWRRAAGTESDIDHLLAIYDAHHPNESPERILKAYEWANRGHTGQLRRSGEPYIHHPVQVAQIVAELGLSDETVAAALLHDTVEDTDVSLPEIQREFGELIALLIDGCTKIDRVKFDSKEKQQAASVRKLLLAVAKDPRVLIIKLADRLHNMRTLAVLPVWKQQRTATETLQVYAPLAERLGMSEVKTQLEETAFAALHPKWYASIDHQVAVRDPEREIYVTQVITDVQRRLEESGIPATVTGRPKQLWSIYQKMVVKGREFDDIYDLVGIRVITKSVNDCYAAIGQIHAAWTPVTGRFKDYIAMPKFNLYQSLHTTVSGPQGKTVEFQVRTEDMHLRAEHGAAAHFSYKHGEGLDVGSPDMGWLGRILEYSDDTPDPEAFMDTLRTDLDQEEVLVFTPKGEVVTLGLNATPIDFAYAIHTEVGHRCVGARVNGKLMPLPTILESGDTVEIVVSKDEDAGPSVDWLKIVGTPRAANKIRQWFSRERREDAIVTGRDSLTDELRRHGLPVNQLLRSNTLDEVAKSMNYGDAAAMFGAIGDNHVSAKAVASRIERELREAESDHDERVSSSVLDPQRRRRRSPAPGAFGVHVEGLDDVWVRLSKCCTPVPPDDIVGFVTRGRGVSVHRSDCSNASSLSSGQEERVIDVEWNDRGTGMFVATFEVKALDRRSLLRDVADILAEQRVNILASTTRTSEERMTVMQFDVELGDTSQLEALLRRVRSIDSVYDAYRVMPG